MIKHYLLFDDNKYLEFFNNEIMINIYQKLYSDSLKFFLFIFELYLDKNILIKIKNIFFIKLKLFKKRKNGDLLNYFDKTRKQLNEKELNFNLLYSQFNHEIIVFQNKIKLVKNEKQEKLDKRLTFIKNEIKSIQKMKNEFFSIFFSNKKKSNTI